MAEPLALFETRAAANGTRIGFATLNAPRSLNALSLDMADLVWEQLRQWRNDPALACVVLEGAGDKAFCAGGDVVALYRSLSEREPETARQEIEHYFIREYSLDYLVHTFGKPILCWGHGIVMGGGLGLLVGASHRVVTESSRIAMPEVTIGLYPEVGASWFLPRMPGRTGLYAGLTGTHLNAADAVFGGLADYYLLNSERNAIHNELLRIDWSGSPDTNRGLLSSLLRAHRGKHAPPESPLRAHFDVINDVTDHNSVEDIVAAMSAAEVNNAWLRRSLSTLQKGSPTSAKVIFEIYRRAKYLSLKEAFTLELGLTVQFAMHPDLREGVRALLIDKDNQPRWSPGRLEDVSPAYVEEHFVSPWPASQHPFKDW